MAEEYNLTVGKVAKRCGVKVSTLHFYEQKGLIKSLRNAGNQRRYKADVLRRVALIKAAQQAGISLEEIRACFAQLPNLRTPNEQDWQQIATQWRQQIDKRIAHLQQLRDAFTRCIGCGCLSLKRCPIYNPNDQLAARGSGSVLLNSAPDISGKSL